MRFMLVQSPAQVPVKYVSVQCKGGLLTVLYGTGISGPEQTSFIIIMQNSMYTAQYIYDMYSRSTLS